MDELILSTSWWIPCYGLLGAILTLPWSLGLVRRTGPRPAAYLNVLMTVVALIHSLAILRTISQQVPQQLALTWLSVPGLELTFSLKLSATSAGVAVLVTFLSFLAQVYALGYLEKDWGLARFYALMGFFEGAMSGIAISDSLFLSYALLEMLTLSTYLLVGFWYAQPLVVKAARDAFLTKRVGDILLLMGLVSLASFAPSLDFSELADWAATNPLPPLAANLLGLALIAGPTGKCAQFPLHLWLDEAMEAPNPASLLRNTVVVACGAYLLIQLQPVIVMSPVALRALVIIGSMTAIGSSLVAIAQIDLKRAISHSTNAYLGLVFLAVGLAKPELALLLLLTHAFAKALLFMGVGAVILTTNTQNITEMGGLWSRMPATTLSFVIGALGMTGLVPLGCFWAMLQWSSQMLPVSPLAVAILLLVNGLTVFNLVRVLSRVLAGPVQPKTRRSPEVVWPMALVMVTTMILTLLLPVILRDRQLLPYWETLELYAAIALVTSSLVGGGAAAWLFLLSPEKRPIPVPAPIVHLLAYDFEIEEIYRLTVVRVVQLGSQFIAWFDRNVVDLLINGVGISAIFSGELFKYSAPGKTQLYVLTYLLGVVLVGSLITWWLL